MPHYQILIAGGGNAGLSTASKLLAENPKLKLGIIEPSEKHYYQPAWTLVGGGTFDVRDTEKDERDFIPKGADWIRDRIASFDPDDNAVTCTSGTRYTYDYLVVAIGIQLDWNKVEGLSDTLGKNGVTSNYRFDLAPYTWELLRNFKGGNAIFTSPNTPIKCGGAPQKIMYLAGDHIRRNGLQSKTNMHFYSGGTIIFGVRKYADTLDKVVARYGIKTHFRNNLVAIDGPNRIATFTDENGQRIAQPFDMIHVTPPQSAPDILKHSALAVPDNPYGWVDVNKYTLQHNRYPNVFSLGDVSSTPNAKTGAAVRKQMPVVVANLLHLISGASLDSKYDGYGSCPLVTGYGRLVLAEFNYENEPTETFPINQAKERWSMWMLKKHVLPWLYWHRILQGRA